MTEFIEVHGAQIVPAMRNRLRRHRQVNARGIGTQSAICALLATLFPAIGLAQSAKELKVKTGQSVVLVNMINPRPDCSVNPGPVAIPNVSKVTNGAVQMIVIVTDVSASDKCPARKVPSIALVYTPNKGFVGSESVTVDVEAGNQRRTLSYQITVQNAAEPL